MSDIASWWLKPVRTFHKRKERIQLPPKVKQICAAVLDNCQREARDNGYCVKHGKHNRRYGTPYTIKEVRQKRYCSIDGCTKEVRSRDLCDTHYRRLIRHGSPYIVHKRGGWNAKKR